MIIMQHIYKPQELMIPKLIPVIPGFFFCLANLEENHQVGVQGGTKLSFSVKKSRPQRNCECSSGQPYRTWPRETTERRDLGMGTVGIGSAIHSWLVVTGTMGKPWENHGKTMGKPWENLWLIYG